MPPPDQPEDECVAAVDPLPAFAGPPQIGRAVAFSALLISIVGNYCAYASLGAATEQIRAKLSIGNTELGVISAAAPAFGILASPLAGRVLDRASPPRACLSFALLAVFGCLLVGAGSTWQQVAVGRACFGAGACGLLVGGTFWAAVAFERRWHGLTQGLVSAAAAFGVVLAALLPTFASSGDRLEVQAALFSGLLTSGIGAAALLGASIRSGADWHRSRSSTDLPDGSGPSRAPARRPSTSFVLLAALGFLMAAAVEPFCITFGVEYLTSVHDLRLVAATMATGSIYLLLVLMTPALGALLSSGVRRCFALIPGALLLIVAFTVLVTAQPWTYAGIGLLAIAYALLTAAFWPLIADIVPRNRVGLASGVLLSVMSLGTAVSTLAMGMLLDSQSLASEGDHPMERIPVFLGSVATILLVVALLLWWTRRHERPPPAETR
jgi:MFS family permease